MEQKEKDLQHQMLEVLIHQPLISGGLAGQTTEIKIHADHMVKTREKLNKLLSEKTGQSLEQIEKDTERDHYMTAGRSFSIWFNRWHFRLQKIKLKC